MLDLSFFFFFFNFGEQRDIFLLYAVYEWKFVVSINVLVAKYGKSCGLVSIFHKRNLRTKPKNLILHILAKFASDILNSKSFKPMEITWL